VLGRVGRLLAGSVRASDVAARVGGDEFVLLLWNLNETQANLKARALEKMIEDSGFELSGKRFEIGLSAGFTMIAAEDSAASVLARADAAMYARKKERKKS
jgi:diguanylate cyclase (GGDEF)-like protein